MICGSILCNHGPFSELMANIFGIREVMQDFLCHGSLVKGDQRLYSYPFTSPSVLVLGLFALVCNRCSLGSLVLERVLQTSSKFILRFNCNFVILIKLYHFLKVKQARHQSHFNEDLTIFLYSSKIYQYMLHLHPTTGPQGAKDNDYPVAINIKTCKY